MIDQFHSLAFFQFDTKCDSRFEEAETESPLRRGVEDSATDGDESL